MFNWLTQLFLNLKLIFKNPFFAILPVLFGIWMTYYLMNPAPFRPYDMLYNTYDFHKFGHTMTLGITFLIGILLIRRDLQLKSFEWTRTFAGSMAGTILAKYTAGLIYFSVFTAVMAAVYAVVGAFFRNEPFGQYGIYLWHDVLQYQWSYAVTLALAMILTAAIPHRIIYLIGFCTWMFGTYFMDIFIIDSGDLYFLRTFHLNQYTLDSILNNQVWGIHLLGSEIWASRLFVAAFAGMLIVSVITLLNKRLARTQRMMWRGGTAVSIAIAGLLLMPYGLIWAEKLEQHAVAENEVEPIPVEEEDYQVFQVSEYDIDLHRHDDNRVEATVSAEIPAEAMEEKEEIYFRLNPLLTLQELQWNNSDMAYEREGSLITIPLAEETETENGSHTVRFDYEGYLTMWGYDFGQEKYYSFVEDENILLSSVTAWYPLAGEQPVFARDFNNNVVLYENYFAGRGWDREASDFNLRLTGFKDDIFATADEISRDENGQTFMKENGTGVSLYGGNLAEYDAGTEFSVIGPPAMEGRFSPVMDEMEAITSFLNESFNSSTTAEETLFLLPGEYLWSSIFNSLMPFDDVFMMSAYVNVRDYSTRAEEQTQILQVAAVTQLIQHHFYSEFNMGGSFSAASLEGLVTEAAYFVYLKEHLGLSGGAFVDEANLLGTYETYTTEPEGVDYGDFSMDEEWVEREIQARKAGGKVIEALEDGYTEEVKEFLNLIYEREIEPQAEQEPEHPDAELLTISEDVWIDIWEQVMADAQ